MRMRTSDRCFLVLAAKTSLINYFVISVNDGTVPYVSAAIELEDPFIFHQLNGVKVYVSLSLLLL